MISDAFTQMNSRSTQATKRSTNGTESRPIAWKTHLHSKWAAARPVQFSRAASTACSSSLTTQANVLEHLRPNGISLVKSMIVGVLNPYGVNPCVEVSGGTGEDHWKADVYFEVGDRKSSSLGAVLALWRRVLLAGQG